MVRGGDRRGHRHLGDLLLVSVLDHNLVLPSPGQIRIFNDSGYELDAQLTVYEDEWVLVIRAKSQSQDAEHRSSKPARRRGDTTGHPDQAQGAHLSQLK